MTGPRSGGVTAPATPHEARYGWVTRPCAASLHFCGDPRRQWGNTPSIRSLWQDPAASRGPSGGHASHADPSRAPWSRKHTRPPDGRARLNSWIRSRRCRVPSSACWVLCSASIRRHDRSHGYPRHWPHPEPELADLPVAL